MRGDTMPVKVDQIADVNSNIVNPGGFLDSTKRNEDTTVTL